MVAFDGGCAQTGVCPEGETLVNGVCVGPPPVPPPKAIDVYCKFSNDPRGDGGLVPDLPWELEVELEEPIVAGERFGARFRGDATFSAAVLNQGEVLLGGFKRVVVQELQATVHVRKGATATGPDPILTLAPIDRTCTYDDDGNTGPEAGPFPMCSQTNDRLDGSNDDCTGLGGMPRPENRCLPFVVLVTSDDCTPGGVCDEGSGIEPDTPCAVNGFCVTEAATLVLEESVSQGYMADRSGSVLFGWDDQSVDIREDGPNEGTQILPVPVLTDPVGPMGIRILIRGFPFVWGCTMGVLSTGECGVNSRDILSSPTPDAKLISFPIQQR